MTSVLDQMVANTGAIKQAAALTPVGTEKRVVRDEVVFLGHEAVLDVIRDLRRAGDEAYAAAARLEAGIGITPEQRLSDAIDTEEKLREREADRKAADREAAEAGDKAAQKRVDAVTPETEAAEQAAFRERMERLQAKAQADTFAAQDAPAPEPERVTAASGSPASNWVCPEHGDQDLKDLTSNRGRKYRACKVCSKFEK